MSAAERGSGTLLASLVIAAVMGLTAALVVAGLVTGEGHRIQGGADLAAIAGAQAQLRGADACAAVRESADANRVGVRQCTVVGDEVEFVVRVEVDAPVRIGAWSSRIARRANAGIVDPSLA